MVDCQIATLLLAAVDFLSEFFKFALKATRKDWKATPRLGIQVLVVQMEGGSVSLALPLIARPKPEELFNPLPQLSSIELLKLCLH